MKAIFFEEHGDIDVLKYADLPDPKPAPGEALIKVRAVALNHMDIWVRKGWEGLHLEMPHIGGCDIAGQIVSVNGATSWTPGTRVIVNPGVLTQDDEWVRRGEDSISPGYKIIGEQIRGGLAEYVVVPIENVYKLPEKVSYEDGAAPLLVGTTCWRMLFVRGQLRAGETVLIVGSGGGVNTAAVQFAKAAGATVFVLAGSPEKAKKAKKIGADETILYTDKHQWHLEVMRLTKGRGVDLVVDNVGSKTIARSLRAVRRGGRIVTVGNTSGPDLKIDNRLIFTKQVSLIGSTVGGRQDFVDAMQFMWDKNIKPVIDREEPLKKGIEMIKYLEEGKQFGKVVLTLS